MIKAIAIDTREPDHIKNLKFGGSIPVVVNQLDLGDLLAVCDDGCTLCIERKTPDDLLNSLASGRLMVQLGNMAIERDTQLVKPNPANSYWPYLVISGIYYPSTDGHVITQRGVTGWTWGSLQGALATIQEMGVAVVSCSGDGDYEACVKRLAERERKKDLLILPARPANILSQKDAFIASLPGIGVERIVPVMAWAANHPTHALMGITDLRIESPIPRATRVKIRQFLGLQENETIEIYLNDTEKQ